MKWIQDGYRVRKLLRCSGFESGEPVHRDDLDLLPTFLGSVCRLFRLAVGKVLVVGESAPDEEHA